MKAERQIIKEQASLYYKENSDHIRDELKKLDLLLQLLKCKATKKDGTNSALVQKELEIFKNIMSEKVKRSMEAGIFLGFPALTKLFGLTPFEQNMVIICLSHELSEKYEKTFLSLEVNHGSPRPTKDLIIKLLCPEADDQFKARAYFRPGATVFSTGIVEECVGPSLSDNNIEHTYYKIDQRILDFIMGFENMDTRLNGVVEILTPTDDIDLLLIEEETKTKLKNLITHEIIESRGTSRRLVLSLYGSHGRGKKELALSLCKMLHCNLLSIDCNLFSGANEEFEGIIRIAFREGLLQAGLFFYNFDNFQEDKLNSFLRKIALINKEFGWLTFFGSEEPLQLDRFFQDTVTRSIHIPPASLPIRKKAWKHFLERADIDFKNHWPGKLAVQSHLSYPQIQKAVTSAILKVSMIDNSSKVSLEDLERAARGQYIHKLDQLARKVVPQNQWEEIILPENTKGQLTEICTWVKHRHQVLEEWGYGSKFSYGNGINALFHGPSGTGKTMAATALAGKTGLDLYRIDLSALVSKYIGETEKNLSALFKEAAKCHAILFFDEADALFAKRTDISDAHDRYSNMETSYLLQKIEEYEGVTILSSNLKQNIDQAFLRRIQFLIEFSFPDKISRLEIWKNNHPKQAPLADDIDFKFLAENFSLSGGNIKNILLNGAYLAAENGSEIKMEHLLKATKREYEKIGKTWTDKYFQR